jgi:hypothetical protein
MMAGLLRVLARFGNAVRVVLPLHGHDKFVYGAARCPRAYPPCDEFGLRAVEH